MASTSIIDRRGGARLVSIAHEIVTAQEYDWFGSSKDAQAHASAEGIKAKKIVHGLGHGDYSRVPRRYPVDLKARIRESWKLLEGLEAQRFVHIDRSAITFGSTRQGKGPELDVDLVIPRHGRSCAFGLRDSVYTRVARDSMPVGVILDDTETLQDLEDLSEFQSQGQLELPLGRSIITPSSQPGDFERAIRDMDRDWENVLFVGQVATENLRTQP